MKQAYLKARGWYEQNERRVSSFFLLFGFVVDSLTLRRVDLFRENAWIILNILLAATCILVVNRLENNRVPDGEEVKHHFWVTNIMQFAFGAQLGTFVIFYFRSGALSVSWPFLFLLLGAIAANELFKKHHTRLTFHTSFLFLSIFSFAIFIVPVLVNRIGAWIFLLSGIVSLALIYLFLKLLQKLSLERFARSRQALVSSILTIYVAMNVLYFANIIPPIPLSLKEGGVYHSISRDAEGKYLLQDEDRGFFEYFQAFPDVHITGGNLYAFSAVFAPTDLDTTIVHVWERFDPKRVRWVEKGRVRLSVFGGRDSGWRTYSTHAGFEPGKWRVSVETTRGQVIGRVRFEVVNSSVTPALTTKVHE